MTLILGDCVEQMRELEEASIDAICTDPPYGLEFMGKDWDRLAPFDRDRATGERRDHGTDRAGGYERSGIRYVVGSGIQEWHFAWAVEAFRILKPGGFLLAFGGTRTYHRLACAVEDAGFEIRDRFWTPGGEIAGELAWFFGSGFPKSLDAAKAIDKALGTEGAYEGVKAGHETFVDRTDRFAAGGRHEAFERPWQDDGEARERHHQAYSPATGEARARAGWGTAIKPAHEPVVVARKPLIGTVAENLLAHGTGAINIDDCRIGTSKDVPASPRRAEQGAAYGDLSNSRGDEPGFDPNVGRWPANVILSHLDGCVQVGIREIKGDGNWKGSTKSVGYEGGWDTSDHPRDQRVPDVETIETWDCATGCPIAELDAQTGDLASGIPGTMRKGRNDGAAYGAESRPAGTPMTGYGDVGGASRFFYCAKVSRAERNAGLEDFEKRPLNWSSGEQNPGTFQAEGTEKAARNHHPTVKPIALMRWLIRLVTPPDGIVLDPFLGSGSTGCAAALESCVDQFLGIERDPGYMAIAEARIAFWSEHGEDALRIVGERDQAEQRRRAIEDAGQLDLFAGAS